MALFWVDILGKTVHKQDLAGNAEHWSIPFHPSAIGMLDENTSHIACEQGIMELELATGITRLICPIESDNELTRANDGAVDPAGRFWLGTMAWEGTPAIGSIYSYREDEGLRRHFGDWGIPNTFCWSNDAAYMYLGDSAESQVYRYDFNARSGELSNKIVFIDDRNSGQVPDGSTVDGDGFVWNAKWDGGKISRYSPDARRVLDAQLPVPRPTSITLGGADRSMLFVTSARDGLSTESLKKHPNAGCVFMAKLFAEKQSD